MNYFDKPVETEQLWCAICKRTTVHDRTVDGVALWTCRDAKHSHPTRDDQQAERKSVDAPRRLHIERVVPPMYDEADYFEVCAERDRYVVRCKELEKKLDEIRKVVTSD